MDARDFVCEADKLLKVSPSTMRLKDMCTFYQRYAQHPDDEDIDIVEMFGGAARTSHILVRRYRRTSGLNFDILVGFDLLNGLDLDHFWKYLQAVRPFIIVMAPPCKGLAGWQNLNKVVHRKAWLRSRRIGIPLAKLCAQVARFQLSAGHHFLSENPKGSDKYELEEWLEIRADPRTDEALSDQCQTGLVDEPSQLPIRKTNMWSPAKTDPHPPGWVF